MSGIGSQFSINNKSYDVDKTNKGDNQTSVRQTFADKLKEVSENNNINEDEKQQLLSLTKEHGATASEIAIVASFSKAAKMTFDPDASGPMNPVEVTFGTPVPKSNDTQQSTNTGAVTPPKTPDPDPVRGQVIIGDGEFAFKGDVSQSMGLFLKNAVKSGKGIGYAEFQQLAVIAAKTGTPGDLEVVKQIANLAATQKDDKTSTIPIKVGSNGEEIKVRIVDTPPPEGRPGEQQGGWGGFLNTLINTTLPRIAAQWAENKLRNVTGTTTPTPTSGTPTSGTPTSGAGNSTSGAGNPKSGIGNSTSGIGNSTSGTGNPTSGTGNPTSGTGNPTSGTGNPTSGTGNPTSGTGTTTLGLPHNG